ncbi:MAG TPA: extracellular solute-binding protein [Xanthobacteraceae bacterium]|nr:extracellular solute-binding protein [Xanthobacteraceae bacterium]
MSHHPLEPSVSVTRRGVLGSLASLAALLLESHIGLFALLQPARAQPSPAAEDKRLWRHGLSLFGDLKYPPGFKHFDYVNPEAPKAGAVRMIALGTFDNFNIVVAGVRGSIAAGIDNIYDTLMTSALDEVSAEYGLLAEAVTHPDDFSSVTYRLRPQARWHDGRPVTVEDVIFSFEAFKKHSPFHSAYYRYVTRVEKTGDREVTFTFARAGNRELPQIVGQLTVLPKHWWEGQDANGRKRDIGATTLEPPLGCGAYRIKEFIAGRTVVYERVPDYWGKDLNVNIGRDNFNELRYEYFRDATVAIEAFKADHVDWRFENSAKNWATAYDFPAVANKRVVLEEFPIRSRGIMQAFVFNTRLEKFKDSRVRRAFNFAFNFEEMNKQIFYGQYRRIASYFEGTELASSGLPQGKELEILEKVRDKVPPEVFTTPYTNPVVDSPEAIRNNLREATRLLREAGWSVRDEVDPANPPGAFDRVLIALGLKRAVTKRVLRGSNGEPMRVEFMVDDPNSERVALFYKPSLERLGMEVTIRTVDPTQYQNRLRQRDFDIVVASWAQSLSPGNEQLDYWGSKAADDPGSRNLAGIKNEAVDALIEAVIYAKDRAELVAATKALDRVLLWNHYVVPQWTYDKVRAARWDRFSRPPELPKYAASAFPTVWWWDAEKAARVRSRQ